MATARRTVTATKGIAAASTATPSLTNVVGAAHKPMARTIR